MTGTGGAATSSGGVTRGTAAGCATTAGAGAGGTGAITPLKEGGLATEGTAMLGAIGIGIGAIGATRGGGIAGRVCPRAVAERAVPKATRRKTLIFMGRSV